MALTATAQEKTKSHFPSKPKDFKYTGDVNQGIVLGELKPSGYAINVIAQTFSKKELIQLSEIFAELATFSA